MATVELSFTPLPAHVRTARQAGIQARALLAGLSLAQCHREKSVLGAVVGKDVSERRGNHGAESEIRQRPHRVLARGTAAEIFPRNQNAGACVTRLVQNKPSVLLPIRCKSPVIKQKLSKARALNPLQKLFGNDLVGVNVDAIQRCHKPSMSTKRFQLGNSRSRAVHNGRSCRSAPLRMRDYDTAKLGRQSPKRLFSGG